MLAPRGVLIMSNKAFEILKRMAQELPGLKAAAVVNLEDGLSIAEFSTEVDVDVATASAYLASIVQSNLQALKLLAPTRSPMIF